MDGKSKRTKTVKTKEEMRLKYSRLERLLAERKSKYIDKFFVGQKVFLVPTKRAENEYWVSCVPDKESIEWILTPKMAEALNQDKNCLFRIN